MTNISRPERSGKEIEAEARAWFVGLIENPTPRKRAEFEAWRQADPANAEAFRSVAVAWEASERPGKRLAEAEAEELAVYLKAMDGAQSGRKATRRLTSLAVVLSCLLGGAMWLEKPNILQDMTADYVSPRAERVNVQLADGSTVLLDADSALSEDFSAGERRMHLLRGAAFFDVTHDAARPFVVTTGEGEVRVLGTRFDVRLLDGKGVVTLAHGSVLVTAGSAGSQTVLVPGQRARFDGNGIQPPETVDLEDSLSWRNGRFVFYRARLADVVHEIGRYRKGRILIASQALADERVTGSFSLDDTDAALASLRASVGFRVTALAGRLTLITP